MGGIKNRFNKAVVKKEKNKKLNIRLLLFLLILNAMNKNIKAKI